MKFTIKLATIASLTLTQLLPATPATQASTFTETDFDQTQVIAITNPYGDDKYNLLVVEQIPGKKKCWAEKGSNPIMVEPLLLNFDFTGICRRATDSNGYSMRLDGKDYGLDYLLRLVPRGNELLLVATHRVDSKQQEVVIGRTNGLVRGFMKIELVPGWKFSKRTFGKKVLGHYYFSGSASAIKAPAANIETKPATAKPESSVSVPVLPVPQPPKVTEPESPSTPAPKSPAGQPQNPQKLSTADERPTPPRSLSTQPRLQSFPNPNPNRR
jgi:N-acetylmuramoyl-L-alanine amidase